MATVEYRSDKKRPIRIVLDKEEAEFFASAANWVLMRYRSDEVTRSMMTKEEAYLMGMLSEYVSDFLVEYDE